MFLSRFHYHFSRTRWNPKDAVSGESLGAIRDGMRILRQDEGLANLVWREARNGAAYWFDVRLVREQGFVGREG